MFNLISKPAEQIAINDITALIETQVPEGEQIEFKESLRRRKNSPDPWILGKNEIGDGARDEVLEEAVAFANAHGGALLIGIRESESNPPVAAEITPVPRCFELAERFKLKFRDCVEPQIPNLEVFAIPTDSESGVVIIRVGRSRLAPHRVKGTLKCTVRQADRCESMTMREIQDMTLNVSRGMERLDKRLKERSERFGREFDLLATPGDAFGLRFTALPVGEEARFHRVYRQRKLDDALSTPWRTVTQVRRRRLLKYPYQFPPLFWRAILRGARADIRPSGKEHLEIGYQELHCDGLLEWGCAACSQVSLLGPDLPLVLFANTLAWADHIRSQSTSPIDEYGIEVEIRTIGNPVRVGSPDDRTLMALMKVASGRRDSEIDNLAPKISDIMFPRYSSHGDETAVTLLSIFNSDFWNWLGEGR